MSVILINKVSRSYGSTLAIDGLDLQVTEGDIYGFIGPNGAGKSTTIRMLLNFIRPDAGEISMLGLHPQKDEVQIKKMCGYVSAETFMYPDMKVNELFHFTESFHGIRVPERIEKLCGVLDIDRHKRFRELSFGNRKKISIACALLHSPKLLIMDEPTNGLDPVIRNNLYELLREEQKQGVTIFYSSHVLGEVRRFCTRIGLIKEGKLIKESSAEEFIQTGYLHVRIESDALPEFNDMPGVAGLEREGTHLQFMFSGDTNLLMQKLAGCKLRSVYIEEPDLENVFMHYFNNESHD
jgi:ABC-2 type transport system ATP-binding protein